MKPATPILRNEHYLDVMTGGSASLPSPILREERYLAKLAGMDVSIPSPVTIKEKYYAKICGMDVDVPTYTRNMPRIYAYMAKAAGQTIDDLPTAVTREQRYWYDYVSEQPVTEHEYTGAVPYTFTANGEPLLDWRISGNTVQSTTPTPDNPIMPQGTGERTGNLVEDYIANCNIQSDGKLISNPSFNMFVAKILQGQTYSLDTTLVGGFFTSKPSIGSVTYNNNRDTSGVRSFVAPIDGYIAYRKASTETTAMLNTGSTALPYEPFGVKIPISSANTTTPIYLGEVETTRRVKKLVLTGEETISGDSAYNRFLFTIPDMRSEGVRLTKLFCTHYQNIADGRPIANVPNNSIYTGGGADSQKVFIKTADYTTAADFKSYLAAQYAAGTPVTIWYVLATEETAVVNEPLMKIDDYADEVSNVATIPTVNGSNALDVDTTVPPSEVYIKYKGV